MPKVKMAHPRQWGNGWYADKDMIPFRLIDGLFIEQYPIKIPEDFILEYLK